MFVSRPYGAASSEESRRRGGAVSREPLCPPADAAGRAGRKGSSRLRPCAARRVLRARLAARSVLPSRNGRSGGVEVSVARYRTASEPALVIVPSSVNCVGTTFTAAAPGHGRRARRRATSARRDRRSGRARPGAMPPIVGRRGLRGCSIDRRRIYRSEAAWVPASAAPRRTAPPPSAPAPRLDARHRTWPPGYRGVPGTRDGRRLQASRAAKRSAHACVGPRRTPRRPRSLGARDRPTGVPATGGACATGRPRPSRRVGSALPPDPAAAPTAE